MQQFTTSSHLTRTIHQLEQIEAEEAFPATQAAFLLAETLCEIAPMLPEEDQQQIARIVALYGQCAYKQYGPLNRRHRRKGH
jgi:hypothetical protein